MKGKKTTYLLICCVAVVWGVIFYRVFTGMAAEQQPEIAQKSVKEPYFNIQDHATDVFRLDLSYPDPFSDPGVEPAIVPAGSTLARQSTPLPPPRPKTDWSGINCLGELYNSTQRKHIAIINIKGKEVMLTEGQRSEGLRFIKRVGDSIQVEYLGTSRYLSIK